MLRLNNLLIIKVNKKPEITSVCCTSYLWNKISVRKPLFDMLHIQLFCFPLNVSCNKKQNINRTKVSHLKFPSMFFIFVTRKFKIINCRLFWSDFHLPTWPLKSDYSSLSLHAADNIFACVSDETDVVNATGLS